MKLAAHLIPNHWGQEDDHQLRRIQPKSIKLVDFFDRAYSMHEQSPASLLVLRDWALSEQKDDVKRNATATGGRHANEMAEKIDRHCSGIPRAQIVVVGINEPPVWDGIEPWVEYTVAFLDRLTAMGIRGGALNLSVGWPANTGLDTPPDWAPYEPVREAILRGNHLLILHEYWDNRGPQHNWGWWAGRYTKCPWDVPIIIGECGLDQYVSDPTVSRNARGWRGQVGPNEYWHHLQWYEQQLQRDDRVHSAQIFTWDYGSNDWHSFDVREIVSKMPTNDDFHHVYLPTISRPTPEPSAGDNFERAIPFVFRIEGGLSMDPNDAGNWTGCAPGKGELKGTNHGISACSYPNLDIRNLTKAQALEIYRRDYWQASGADKLDWPMCLIHLDTAVNHGVARAKEILSRTQEPTVYLAQRIRAYTSVRRSDPAYGNRYWRAWMERVARLLEVIA